MNPIIPKTIEDMINDNELNKLEESADIRHLLKEVQAMRDEENAQCTPPPFDSLMERMKEKEAPRTIPFPTKNVNYFLLYISSSSNFLAMLSKRMIVVS